jgi:hypothetical protein
MRASPHAHISMPAHGRWGRRLAIPALNAVSKPRPGGKSSGSIKAMWGSLSARQRMVAGALTALVIAAGIYRWIAFGDINRLHGSGAPTTQNLVGESEFLRPTVAEVDQSARSNARAEGELRQLSCHEVPGHTWSCTLHFVGGLTVVYRGLWNYTRGTVAWSVVERKTTAHSKLPTGQ